MIFIKVFITENESRCSGRLAMRKFMPRKGNKNEKQANIFFTIEKLRVDKFIFQASPVEQASQLLKFIFAYEKFQIHSVPVFTSFSIQL